MKKNKSHIGMNLLQHWANLNFCRDTILSGYNDRNIDGIINK